jgi:Two component regulator propeller
MSLICTISL